MFAYVEGPAGGSRRDKLRNVFCLLVTTRSPRPPLDLGAQWALEVIPPIPASCTTSTAGHTSTYWPHQHHPQATAPAPKGHCTSTHGPRHAKCRREGVLPERVAGVNENQGWGGAGTSQPQKAAAAVSFSTQMPPTLAPLCKGRSSHLALPAWMSSMLMSMLGVDDSDELSDTVDAWEGAVSRAAACACRTLAFISSTAA